MTGKLPTERVDAGGGKQEPGDYRSISPHVHVVHHPRPAPAADESRAAVALQEDPLRITPQGETRTEGYIEIVDAASGNRVVTVIEYLSPTNKLPDDDRVKYRLKQRDEIRAGANLVEIDLTRSGQRGLALREAEVPLSHRTTYRICVWRSEPDGVFELYRVPLLARLPSIQVPLRATDSDIGLDLQPLVDRCFDMGDYDDFDYRADPDPPLKADDAEQPADEWLRSKGLR